MNRYVEPASFADRVSRIVAIADRGHLVALGVFQELDEAPQSVILQAPSLKRLRSLSLWSHTRRLIELACELPLLATLTLQNPLPAADASLLLAAPSLTDLSVIYAHEDLECMSSVLQCPKLRRLALSCVSLEELLAVGPMPGWQQLRELSLSPSGSWDSLPETVAAVLSSLRSLRVLQLEGQMMDPLLAHLHLIPTLRRLIIDCDSLDWSDDLPHSDAAMLSLLRSSPDLALDWLVDPSISDEWLEPMLRPLIAEMGAQLIHFEEELDHDCYLSRFRLVRDA